MMKRATIAVVCIAVFGSAAFAATATPPKGKVSVTFPGDAGSTFKPGPGAAAAMGSCLTCHSAGYVSTQPLLTKAQWNGEVLKMKNVYGAPIADDQIPALVDYLTANYGKP